MKEKNKRILGSEKPKTLNVTLPSDLQVMQKETLVVKEKKNAKPKKVDNSVQQVNINFRTEDNTFTGTKYQKPQYQQNKKPQKAKINFDDLPSL